MNEMNEHNKGFKWFRRLVVRVKTTTQYNGMLSCLISQFS